MRFGHWEEQEEIAGRTTINMWQGDGAQAMAVLEMAEREAADMGDAANSKLQRTQFYW